MADGIWRSRGQPLSRAHRVNMKTSTAQKYVLVTAAYNEEALIEATIQSVAAQTVPPARWVIVSDGSTDRTDEIVQRYAVENPWIHLHRITEDHPRNFAAQVYAINAGMAQLQGLDYDFIGNLDADVTMGPEYFERLLLRFKQDPQLGLAGGAIHEKAADGQFRARLTNSPTSVAHACQLFRRGCFSAVGGAYVPLPYGGPDAYAETTARMKGWRVQTFDDLVMFHHRPAGSAGGLLRSWYRQGKMDYSLGALPLFELFKLAKRVAEKPYGIGALARLAGFINSYLRGEDRAVSEEFVAYLRKEHKRRLINLFRPT